MDPGDALATIAEGQIGTRSDAWSDRGNLYGYLMATGSRLADFGTPRQGRSPGLHWVRPGFATPAALHVPFRATLRSGLAPDPSTPDMLRLQNWCAAFVDWCVLQLLLRFGHTTSLSLAHRPRTASAFGLLDWGRRHWRDGCAVLEDRDLAPRRGDVAVFKFSHVGIVSSSEASPTQFTSVEGNTTQFGHGNQGYVVARRVRSTSELRGLIRLPERGQQVLDPVVGGRRSLG